MGRKRRADVPLTEAQEREAAAMLLPTTLPFKLKQAEGRSVRNTKASVAACPAARGAAHLLPACCARRAMRDSPLSFRATLLPCYSV